MKCKLIDGSSYKLIEEVEMNSQPSKEEYLFINHVNYIVRNVTHTTDGLIIVVGKLNRGVYTIKPIPTND